MSKIPNLSRLKAIYRHEFSAIPLDLVLNTFVSSPAIPRRIRTVLLSATGHDIHPTAMINPRVHIGGWSGLTLGERSFINYGCFFDLGAPITVEDKVSMGYECMLITCGHEIGTQGGRVGPLTYAPIVIGRGAWLGARVTVLPGVTIGEGAIIAAGSVVSSDCEPDMVYAGVPAVAKKSLGDPLLP